MPVETYSSLPSTVLAYKRDHHIGRFDPSAPELQQRKVREIWAEVESAGRFGIFLVWNFWFNGDFMSRGRTT